MQAAIPNMKVFFKKDESNSVQLATMYLAMSYKIGQSPEMLSIEPKVSYWAADGIDNIWNLAAKVNLLDETLSFTGMLNSTKSSSLGLGIDQKRFLIQGFYTSHLAGQRESTGGSFELHLRIKLLNKENPGIQSAGF